MVSERTVRHEVHNAVTLYLSTLAHSICPLLYSSILTHCVVGKGQSSSRVMDGVLVDLKPEMTSLFQELSGDLHVAVRVCVCVCAR